MIIGEEVRNKSLKKFPMGNCAVQINSVVKYRINYNYYEIYIGETTSILHRTQLNIIKHHTVSINDNFNRNAGKLLKISDMSPKCIIGKGVNTYFELISDGAIELFDIDFIS